MRCFKKKARSQQNNNHGANIQNIIQLQDASNVIQQVDDVDNTEQQWIEKFEYVDSSTLVVHHNREINLLLLPSNLIKLVVMQCGLNQLQIQPNLYSLSALFLNMNSISDISPLAPLKLKTLNLSFNLVSCLKPLSQMTSLVNLNLFQNIITDISLLKDLISLETLILAKNNLLQAIELKYLTKLEHLDISMNEIYDISFCVQLKQLNKLHLFGNQICNINSLKELEKLQMLDIGNNFIINKTVIEAHKSKHYFYTKPQTEPKRAQEQFAQIIENVYEILEKKDLIDVKRANMIQNTVAVGKCVKQAQLNHNDFIGKIAQLFAYLQEFDNANNTQ
ncbi:leucine-rich_repeat domain-containing protein [Hexamita inflata]|uniref:Leucine-rich repeat domain-containing protein n=1 Tax=Hexamita inflata TaxID=28002 RepID=A0AA86PZL6_9EUKA|nr:leucine-rich repeat domain-containing protein [Hexamita inflata]